MRVVPAAIGLSATALMLSACGRVDELLWRPQLTPEQWCAERPCTVVSGIVIAEPSSSVLVFALAALWIAVGVMFLVTRRGQRSRTWFGVSLALGGLAAGSAGISYQAFSYELKCAGRTYCALTNGFEITYSVLQVASISAMVIAIGYALASSRACRWIRVYALLNVLAYMVVTLAGIFLPSAFALSFELLLVFAVPSLIIVAVLAIRHRSMPLARRILLVLVILVLVQLAYLVYFALGITQSLWANGVYFSANDVLHVGMVIWLLITMCALRSTLRDR